MAKHKFKQTERHAVYSTHGEKCYLCGAALTMKSVEIDHVIPESLGDDPEAFAAAREALGRNDDFDLNSYENWLPACRPCNQKKRAMVWEPSGIAQVNLQRAAASADKARGIAAKLVTDRNLAQAVAVLEAAGESGELSWETMENLAPIVEQYMADRPAGEADEPVRVNDDVSLGPIQILSDDGLTVTARGPYGVGGGPSGVAAPAMRCSVCGFPYFNGARCVACGTMDDD
ncbi:MAG: hypothetical protein KDB04_12040 [Acidimicrobiales bacterium]|nr:hypothetical protein [Acidimicrobiales bacterium]